MDLSDNRRALLELLIRGNGHGATAAAPAPAIPLKPASYAQRRLWFLNQINHDHTAYTLHSVRPLNWSVNPALLNQAIREVALRHDILRTTFLFEQAELAQRVNPQAPGELDVEDLRRFAAQDRNKEAMRLISALAARKFDLEAGPLWRTALYQLDDKEWIFLLVVHHIIFDGPSFDIFFSELNSIYGALASDKGTRLPSLSQQYGNFAQAQRDALTPERVAAEVEFWRSELANLPMLDLPLDRPRSAMETAGGSLCRFTLSEKVTAELQQLASRQSVTLFTVLLAGLAAALARVCAQYDFAIGLPVAGRDEPAFRQAIGFFVDTVVVRCKLQGNPTMREVVQTIGDAVKRSLAHRVLPFELLVEHLRPPRGLGINPLFQVGFQLMHDSGESFRAGPLEIPRLQSMFDLGIDLWLYNEHLEGRIEFNTALFDQPTIDLIAAVFKDTLSGLSDADRRLDDLDFNLGSDSAVVEGEKREVDQTIWQLLETRAGMHSEEVALEGPGVRFTYAQLHDQVVTIAGALRRRGVTPGSFVALVLPRSVDLVLFEIATWCAGAAFIPVDPNWPDNRREAVLRDSRPVLTIDQDLAGSLINESPDANLNPTTTDPKSAAYVIFTSGSTGNPKGVVLEQAGLVNVALFQKQLFGLGPGRRVAQLAQPSFDASIFEVTLALASGATLVVPPNELLVGDELSAFLEQNRVDTIVLPPTLLATMQPDTNSGLRLILAVGESCSVDLAGKWSDGREFWNLYGPTEATIWATFGRGAAGSRVPIGRPVPNITTMVLNAGLRPVPIGVPGELCLAGIGLAREYLDSPELTAQRFVTDPTLPDRRIYRTGDLVKQTLNGDLIFLGRIDRQTKVHGFRIELEEIETALRKHPDVMEAVVTTFANAANENALVAYLQSSSDNTHIKDECRDLLKLLLPYYMIPNHFVFIDDFPRTTSGKIDFSSLPPPVEELHSDTYVEPSTDTERRVAELMASAIRLGRVGAEDHFFQIGGHSLAGAELVRNARAVFKVNLTIRDVFINPTVSALAARIDLLKKMCVVEDDLEVPLVRLPRKARAKEAGS
jgi:amino acid adenylation domain-containing protein